ncbi:MAG TPA: hypothetical protein VIV60_07245 [Polyangiaceae bacterium]
MMSSSKASHFLATGICIATLTMASAAAARTDDDEASKTAADTDDSKPAEERSTDPDSASEPVATNVPEKLTDKGSSSYSHRGQFNLRLGLGASYGIIMRYDRSPACSTTLSESGEEKKFCPIGSPLSLDVAVGYAPLAGVEPFLWGRFGLAKESVSNTAPLVILGAGVRLYTMSDAAFKFFVEPAVGVELEGAADKPDPRWDYKKDFIIRLSLGPQLDFARNVGAYVAGGLTMGVLRELKCGMDLHIGVQARFP